MIQSIIIQVFWYLALKFSAYLELRKLATKPFISYITQPFTRVPPIELTFIALWANLQMTNWHFFFIFSSYFSHNSAIDMPCKLSPQRKQFAWVSNCFLGEKYFKISTKTFTPSAKSWFILSYGSTFAQCTVINPIVILNRTNFRWFSKLDLDVNLQIIL